MTRYSFRLPDLGEGTVEAEIIVWRAGIGKSIKADQPLVDVMTDKATMEITAPVSGVLVSSAGEPGEVIAVGAELAVFDTDPEETDEASGEPATEKDSPASAVEPPGARKPLTSPAVRHLAREHGIDLNQVSGAGPNGRITRADIDAHLAQAEKPVGAGDKPGNEGVSEIKLRGLRRRIAERMSLSASRIPHFSYVEEVDVTELDRLRRQLNSQRQAAQPKLSYLPFVMLALTRVAPAFPRCNAHFDDERQVIKQFEPVHIGIAVQTGDGLMVPVIRHVETLNLWQCAQALRETAERTKNGGARKQELSGSTITITSLGALGGLVSTPIINYPEVAIIGVNRTQTRPSLENGALSNRLLMNLSSSFDHRVVDGHDAAGAIQALKRYLEFPATLFMPGCKTE